MPRGVRGRKLCRPKRQAIRVSERVFPNREIGGYPGKRCSLGGRGKFCIAEQHRRKRRQQLKGGTSFSEAEKIEKKIEGGGKRGENDQISQFRRYRVRILT